MAKITSAIWGFKDETIITGHEDGVIANWDTKTGCLLNSVKDYTSVIILLLQL